MFASVAELEGIRVNNEMGTAIGVGRRREDRSDIDISLIVPTRNEALNVEALLQRVAGVAFDGVIEVIFVDDSDDDTVDVVAAVQDSFDFDIDIIHRSKGERQGGLGGAVIVGLSAARGEFSCILDGDLQHPPEKVAEMHRRAVADSMDLIVGSRYIEDGSANGLSTTRKALSRILGFGVRATFPRRCSGVTDSMSGFFLIRMAKIDLARVKGNGFKILLEIVVTHPELNRAEVAFTFAERHAGETKASVVEGLRFLKALAVLRARRPRT